jgi:hypothetical protein
MATVIQPPTEATQPQEAISFTLTSPALKTVFELTQELADLTSAASLQSWDQQTQMAMESNVVRGPQMATLRAVIHERQTAAALGRIARWCAKRGAVLTMPRACPPSLCAKTPMPSRPPGKPGCKRKPRKISPSSPTHWPASWTCAANTHNILIQTLTPTQCSSIYMNRV